MPALKRSMAWRNTATRSFEDDAPAFSKLKNGLTEVRQTIHSLLNKKRETEPDPVEVIPVAAAQEVKARRGGDTVSAASTGAFASLS